MVKRSPRRVGVTTAAPCLLLALLASAPAAAGEPAAEYVFDLHLDLERGVLRGEGVLAARNDLPESLAALPLVLYPARFRSLDPAIIDGNFDRFYATRFDPGDMRLEGVSDEDGVVLATRPDFEAEGGLVGDAAGGDGRGGGEPFGPGIAPPGVFVRVELRRPVAPGEWVRLRVAFVLEVPRRLGPFGRAGRRVVLEGGALPYVPEGLGRLGPGAPPARGAYDLGLRVTGGDRGAADWNVFVGAQAVAPALVGSAGPGRGRLRLSGGSPFLAAGRGLAPLVDAPPAGEAPAVRVFGAAGDAARAERLLGIAQRAGAFFNARFRAPTGAGGAAGDGAGGGGGEGEGQGGRGVVTLVAAPLRDRFVHVTDEVVLTSDRLFRVFVLLQPFHEVEAARGVLLSLTRQALAEVPLGADRDWVCEAIAWLVTQEAFSAREGVRGADIRAGMDLLSFIPAVDRILRAPRFVGSDMFYGRFHEPVDAVPDGFERALSRRARGRVLGEKLRDVLGEERLWRLVRETLGHPPEEGGEPRSLAERGAWRERASALAGADLGDFFALWLSRPAPSNLSIEGVETLRELPDGSAEVEVRLRREGDPRIDAVGEPVEVEGRGPDGEPVRARWDGKGREGRVVLRHDGGLFGGLFAPLVVDPDHRIDQTARADDRWPPLPLKLLVNRARIRLDLNRANRNEAAVGITLVPRHDYAHRILLDGFYEQDERGISLGYGYGFGWAVDEQTFGAGVSLGLTGERMNRGVLADSAGFTETEGSLLSVAAGVGLDTRIDSSSSTWGFAVGFGVEHSDRVLGTDFRFTLFRGSLTGVFSPVRGTQLAVELLLGQGVGNRLPSQRLLDGGGEDTVRGVQASRFLGRSLAVARTELRQIVADDLDVSLLWVAWLRKVQVAAFLDGGDVGPTIQEVVEGARRWKWGAGGGVRLWLDAFGVHPVVLRFDVGFRIDGRARAEPQYYLGVGQSF